MKGILLLCLLCLSAMASAEVYKWVDDKGQAHYEDQPKGAQAKKIAVDTGTPGQGDSEAANQRKTQQVLDDMEKSRKQREKIHQKKRAEQRKQDAKCLTERNKIRKLEARMNKKHYSEFSNNRPASYQRQEAELADRKQYLDKYCN